ncbi:anti-sigma factor family protein [Lentzea sp. NPDC060358]|uniref:anti-sigma factor family protein n=1 Tax=Lentzea sp. NPDC060358 TaxID=3347103 RepID=UPI003654983B
MAIRRPRHDRPDDEGPAGDGPCGDVAAYVLGVLDPAEHVRFSRHLTGCEGCRRDAADFGAFAPVLRPALHDGVRAPFRVTRGILVVATGVVVAITAVLSVVESLSSHTDNPVDLGTLTRAEPTRAEPFPQLGSI